MASGLINHAYVMNLHENTKREGLENFQVSEHMEVLGEWRGTIPMPCLVYLFHLVVLELYLCTVNW